MSKQSKNSPVASPLKGEEDWRAEEDFRTLQRAAEIYADKARLNRAVAVAKKQQQQTDTMLQHIDGLRKRS